MKRPVLCLFLTCMFTFVTAQPYMSLNAAEIWNKGNHGSEKKKSGKPRYFNTPKHGERPKFDDGEKPRLYNYKKTSKKDRKLANAGSLKAKVFGKKITMSGQKPSKLWSYMSPNAIKNRQADTDFALQQEYNIRKTTAQRMQASHIQSQKKLLKMMQKDQLRMARFYKEREEKEEARQQKKINAFAHLTRGKTKYNVPGTYKSSMEKNSMGMKKPKRIFNDPNK